MTLQQKLNGFRVQFESRGPLHDAPDARRSSVTNPIALAADVRNFRLCHGLVPGCERRREARDDQLARAHGRRLN